MFGSLASFTSNEPARPTTQSWSLRSSSRLRFHACVPSLPLEPARAPNLQLSQLAGRLLHLSERSGHEETAGMVGGIGRDLISDVRSGTSLKARWTLTKANVRQERIAEMQRRTAERAEIAIGNVIGETGAGAKRKQSRVKSNRRQ